VTCGVALSLAAGVLSLLRPVFVSSLDNLFFDTLVRQENAPAGCELPVVVGLDDEALARFGRWPWPRAVVARLLDRLAALGPASIGVDVLFPEPERPAEEGLAGILSEGELALARTLAHGPFVLGCELTFTPIASEAERPPGLHPLDVASLRGPGATEPREGLWTASGAVADLPELTRAVDSSGFLNTGLDPDGVLRRMPLLIRLGDAEYPSLGLAAVLKALGVRQAFLESSASGDHILRVGDRRIPVDARGRLLLRYRRQKDCPREVSAAAVLDGRIRRAAVEGRIVFVGATAAGLGESIATPVDPVLPGVAAHAIAAGNILQRDFARPGSPALIALIVLAAGLAGTIACVGLGALRGALLLGAAATFAWLGSGWLFHAEGLVISPVLPVLALGLNFILLTLARSFVAERRAREQSRDLAATRDFVAESLVSLAAIRDTETGAHLLRTQRYLRILCEAAAQHPRFRDQLTPDTVELMSKLAPIHDIGKVGVPDELLHKPTRLTAEESDEIKKHAAYGRDAIASAETRVAVRNSEFLRIAKDLAYCHHERWDGSGYPQGLSGDRIPLAGRLMAIVDVYDALVTRRIYKAPVSHEEAVRLIREGKGSQFDPDLVDALLSVEKRWRQVGREVSDSGDAPSAGQHAARPGRGPS
jgi:HD-GYP domain-containing protein (c-di-GMP phosphodiesterase class II)